MPLKKNELLDILEQLRNALREKYSTTSDKVLICSDKALIEISKQKPLKMSDFLAISGLDSNFNEMYANEFLNLIITFVNENKKTIKVSRQAYKVLDHYKDRLSNISRTNPNLYMGRIDKNRSFDLSLELQKDDLYQFISSKKNQVDLVLNELQQKHMTTLYRELNKDHKETGAYNCYIAYPYVTGIFKKDNFTIKAPLCYMPVKLLRKKQLFIIERDLEKDIMLNRDLLLATSKIGKHKLDENMPVIQNLSKKSLSEIILPFYESNGLSLSITDFTPFTPFVNERKETFAKKKKGTFEVDAFITLGRYKLYSSMIQKDVASIMGNKKYNDLLAGLIDETNLEKPEQPLDIFVSSKDISESSITYINDLNFSQEKVIEMINKERKMVVWGPPGTGKSQVITSLIASAVLKGENVLVVSEKKVALDVIYNRLQSASKYAMFIDDISNKQAFYEKLSKIIDHTPPKRTINNDIYKLEEEIVSLSNTFDHAIKLMYQDKVGDKQIFELYQRYLRDKDIHMILTPKVVLRMFETNLKKPTFLDIDKLEQTFDKDIKLRDYIAYHQYLVKYPWFLNLETKVSRSSRIEFNKFYETYKTFMQTYQAARLFKRRSLKKQFINQNLAEVSFLTTKKNANKKLLKALLNDFEFGTYIFKELNRLNKHKTVYLTLSKKEVLFLHMFSFNQILKEIADNYKLRTYLFNAFYTGFLENFKATNQSNLFILDEYEKKMGELTFLIEQKKKVSSESFEMALYQKALKLSDTKRIMDIKRILESAHKPSIKSFFDVYNLELLNNIKVWLLTPEVVSAILPLEQGIFDLVIFDEASQMYVEKGIPSIYRAKKVIIAGDPKQLRPSNLGFGRIEDEEELAEDQLLKDVTIDAKSLLDLARYKYKETLLNYHYRSRYEELILFSNHAFYESKLIVSPNVETPKKPPIDYVYVKDGNFINKKNDTEAKEVVKLLKKILKEKDESESVGIITFNASQRDLISDYIDEAMFKGNGYQKLIENEIYRKSTSEDQSLFIKNIENVQGDERDIIIFSMGYAKDESGIVKRRFGWLNHEGGQNRLNVAITRAKKKIYFVSSLYPEEFKVDDLSGTGPKLLKDFMRYCYFISTNNKLMAKEVLQLLSASETKTKETLVSLMTEDIKQRIEKLDYRVDINIGIGSFKLDLAIYDTENEKYTLGIICDIEENSTNSRQSLLHHERFLKARGWTTIRIFHSNWYEDSNKELRRIKEKLK